MAWAALATGGEQLELRGRIVPSPGRASVTMHGAYTPFAASTLSDRNGRFRFKGLNPGAYTVIVFLPGRGEVRRTVEVSPTLADSRGRVNVTIPFSPSGASAAESLKERNTVSMRRLSIPDRARREFLEAQKDLSKDDVASAIQHLQRAVELAPQYMIAWNNLGTIAYQTGRYQDAEKYFRTALEQEPGDFLPVVNLGGVLLNLGKYEEALKFNQYAVQQRPQDALANSQLGMTHFYLGERDPALKYLKIAKKLDPAHFSHPQLMLAEIYLGRSDRQAAIAELEDFLAHHPDAPNAGSVRKEIERLKQ